MNDIRKIDMKDLSNDYVKASIYKIDNKYDFNIYQFDVIITNGFGVVLEMNAL